MLPTRSPSLPQEGAWGSGSWSSAAAAAASTAAALSTPPPPSSWRTRVVQIGWLLFTVVAFFLFVVGLSRNSRAVVRVDGWDEVFAVVGAYWFFPAATAAYHLAARMPFITRALEAKLWFYALQVLLLLTYVAQQGVFIAYLVRYVGRHCWLFMIPDVAVAAMMLASQRVRFAWQWPTLYVLAQAGKLAAFWSEMDRNFEATTPMGADGLLGMLVLTIPVVQFPVLISRLRAGTSLTKAYTTNMAAVFAHVLHFMDVLELYFSGREMRNFPGSVKPLVLFFAVMGHITCNMYYATLFLKDDATARFLRRFEEPSQDGTDFLIAPTEPGRDDELLHYFLWTFFFIDLPYAVMRIVALVVHGKDVSAFLGKNIMMMLGVVMLLMRGRRP
ncbi:hypothetical protein DQ04_05091000 [Trypanosoma grayi]|uniref:hypothetical protein n=1 Tax=Trypanosoma grayi TaxID=71804 RepID=UPI0004F45970|nr:hypothetical protein DQ04_05091000 [Trypanosoma grayi]KEG09514.1 hypothetical protein DQ04_05091000 [Trypanosoma grayi]